MSEEKDTVVEPTETESSVDNGTAAEQVDTEVQTEEQIDKAAYEAALEKAKKADDLEKELQKRDMELNQRRNKEKELELKALEESGKYKELAEKLQKEIEEKEAAEAAATQQKEVDDFRNKIIAEYPDVADVANDLGLSWNADAEDFTSAETQLRAKLDALQAKIASKPATQEDEADPQILDNNPSVGFGDLPEEKLRSMSSKELRKILPKAPSR